MTYCNNSRIILFFEKVENMFVNRSSSFQKGFSYPEMIISVIILIIIVGITVNFVAAQKEETDAGRDVIRCIIDENASNLNSPACKRVITTCSNDKTGFCKKLLFYADDGTHSNEVLSILGNICSKGGEQACDILINRCIENRSNCEILGKSYSIKNYLEMKDDVKDIGKTVMYKKLKNYYDNDVDNIVSSVIKTCMTDKNSMACEIFTSKVYEFNFAEKPSFVIIQNSNREMVFSKTGIALAINLEKNMKKIEEKPDSINVDKNNESAVQTEASDNKQNIPISQKENLCINCSEAKNLEENNSNKNLPEKTGNKILAKEVALTNSEPVKTPSGEKTEILAKTVFKSLLTTGEDNNIDYIKNKIYSFDINYKEPDNTKIKWLVSFDGRATWKKWDGNDWVPVNESSGIENINFSVIGNTSAEIEKGLSDYILKQGENSFDFAVEFLSTDETSTPSIEKVEVKYY
jgi:hypothetical protein